MPKTCKLYKVKMNDVFYFTWAYSNKQAYRFIHHRLKNNRRKYNVGNRVV